MTGGSDKFSYHHIDIAGTTSKFVYKYFTGHCKFKMDQGFAHTKRMKFKLAGTCTVIFVWNFYRTGLKNIPINQ